MSSEDTNNISRRIFDDPESIIVLLSETLKIYSGPALVFHCTHGS